MVENNGLIPNHQFCFRQRHSTIEQTHQIVWINETLANKQYYSAAFVDLSSLQQSMAYWTSIRVKKDLLLNYFLVLKSYLHSRHFLVKAETEYAEFSQ
jgi:hypothetical protein